MFLVRSNYFAVQDEQSFLSFCNRHGLGVIQQGDNPRLFGFLSDGQEQPFLDLEEGGDYIAELSQHLADGSVAVVMQVGNDKMRFFLGHCWALNNKGHVREIDLSDIYDAAQPLGSIPVTRAEY